MGSHINAGDEHQSKAQTTGIFWLLSSSPLNILAKAKYLRASTCALIPVQVKGLEKVSVFLLKVVDILKRQ